MKPPLISFFLLSRVIFHFIYLISKTWYRKMRFLRLFYRHFDAKNILNGAYFLGITSRWPLFMCKQSDYSLNSLQYYVRISFANDYLFSIFMLQAVQVNSMPLILSCPISQCFLVVVVFLLLSPCKLRTPIRIRHGLAPHCRVQR